MSKEFGHEKGTKSAEGAVAGGAISEAVFTIAQTSRHRTINDAGRARGA